MRALLPVLIALAAACATNEPIHDVIDAPIIAPAGERLSTGEVRAAIERAGRALGWQLQAQAPGVFTGRLALRSHLAVIEIEHSDRTYSIKYRDSENLDAAPGQIPRAYNEWIEKLDRAIRVELAQPRQL
jgi:hypothetical protein